MTRLIDEEQAFRVLSAYYKHRLYEQDIALIDALRRVPTADAVPVRHGKWTADEILYTQGMTACSCCKTEYYRDDLYMVGNNAQGEPPNYCPNCGARMDEDE